MGIGISIGTFFGGKHSAAKKDGHKWGELKSDIKHIKENVSEMKTDNKVTAADMKASVDRVHIRIDDVDKKIAEVDKKFDNHIMEYHKN